MNRVIGNGGCDGKIIRACGACLSWHHNQCYMLVKQEFGMMGDLVSVERSETQLFGNSK